MAGMEHVAKQAGVAEADVKKVIEAIKTLSDTENVILRGFGTFKTASRAERNGRNPQTGKPLIIPAKKVRTFKASAK